MGHTTFFESPASTNQDFVYAHGLMELMGANDAPVEFWEAFCLATMRRETAQEEVWRLTEAQLARRRPGVSPAVLDLLRFLREKMGRLVLRLRVLLGRRSDIFPPGDEMEIALAFLTASAQERAAAAAWIDDPVGREEEGIARFRRLMDRARPFVPEIRSLRPCVVRYEETVIDLEVDPGICRALLRTQVYCKVLDAELWETFLAVLADPNADIARLGLRVAEVRAELASLAAAFRAYLGRIPMGRFAPETIEIAIGFTLASPLGRDHARAWLSDPDRNEATAAHLMDGVVGRVMSYEQRLRDSSFAR